MSGKHNVGVKIANIAGLAAACMLMAGGVRAAFPAFNIEERTTEPLMVADQLWESQSLSFLNVIETNGIWHCWYASIDTDYETDDDQIYCYATSSNGVDWVKPNLGRVSYNGSTDNNIILRGGGAGAYVFWDPNAERYRMTSIRYVAGQYVVFGKDSDNGLDWVEYPTPIFPYNADTQNACMWDVDRYRFYPRMWTGGIGTPNSFRLVGYSESTTFTNFPAPSVILATDAMDPPKADFYNSAATKLADNLYVMFPSAFFSLNNGATGPSAETVVPHIAVSTNGVDFVKIGHAPAIPLGTEAGRFDRGSIYVGPGYVPGPRPDTYWFYYVGLPSKHNEFFIGSYKGGLGRFLLTVLPEEDGGSVPLTYKTGLLTWLRADDLDADRCITNNPADGTPVAVWKDSHNAVSGYHGSQTNAVRRPVYRTSGGPNDMPLVSFDGTNDVLELPTITYTNWTLFMVGRMPEGPSQDAVAFSDSGPGAAGTLLQIGRTADAFAPQVRDGSSHTLDASDTNGWSHYAIRSAWVNNKTMNYQVTTATNTYAGAGVRDAAFSPVTFAGNQAPVIGSLSPTSDTHAANLDLCELVLFDHELSAENRSVVEFYLRQKYFPADTNVAPVATFVAAPRVSPAPLQVTFSDLSTGLITNRFWDFGDGNTVNTQSASFVHAFTGAGIYTVSLTVQGPLGNDTMTRSDYITAEGIPRYWDSDGPTVGGSAGTTANGTWGEDPYWNSSSSGGDGSFTATTSADDDLYFSAGTDVTGSSDITLNGTPAANQLTVQEGSITLNGTFTANSVLLSPGGKLTLPGPLTLPACPFVVSNFSSSVESTLSVGHNDALGGIAGNTLKLHGGGNSIYRSILAPVTTDLTLVNNMEWSRYISMGAASMAPFTLTGNVTLMANTHLYPDLGASVDVAGNISDGGNGYELRLTAYKNSIVYRLSGDNTFSGGFYASPAVATTLEIGSDTAFGTGPVTLGGGNAIWTLRTVDSGFGAARTYANDVQIEYTLYGHNFEGSHTFNGQATLNGAGKFRMSGGGSLSLNQGLAEVGGTRTLSLDNVSWADGTLLIGPLGSGAGYSTLANVPNRNYTVIAAGNDALGTNLANTTFASPSTLGFQGDVNYTSPKAITIGGYGVGSLGAIRNFSGTNIFSGPITLSAAISVAVDEGSLALTGAITDGAGTFALTHRGSGTLAFGNTNTYNGATTVLGGVLRLDRDQALPGGIGVSGGTSALTLNGGVLGLGANVFERGLGTGAAQVRWLGSGGFAAYGANQTVNLGGASADVTWASGSFVPNEAALILGASDATHTVDFQNPLNLASAVRTIHVENGAAAIDALLSGPISSTIPANGSLLKTGNGTLQINAVCTYTGPTTINSGTLMVSSPGALDANSVVTVGGESAVGIPTLAGNGSVGAVTIHGANGGAAGHLAPGNNGVGTLTFSALHLDDNSVLDVDLRQTSDRITVNGDLTLGTNVTVNINISGGNSPYTLITYSGQLTGGENLSGWIINGAPELAMTRHVGNTLYVIVLQKGTLFFIR